MLQVVVDANDGALVWERGVDGAVAIVAGHSSDLRAIAVLYESLHLQAATQMATIRRSTPAATQRWRRAFLFGFADRVGELLSRVRSTAEEAVSPSGSARLPERLDRAAHVRTYADQAFGRVVRAAAPTAVARDGWADGHRAAGVADVGRARLAGRRALGRGSSSSATAGGDRGREAVYEAERAAFGGTELDRSRPLADLAGLARSLCGATWWAAAGGPPVRVVAARVDAASSSAAGVGPRATGSTVVIRLAAGHHDVATLAHELAHALAGVEGGHGPSFRAAHLDVVAVLAGTIAAGDLRTAYGRFGVPPGERTWPTPTLGEGPGFVRLPSPRAGAPLSPGPARR